ncbi:MAG: pyruvate kinase [Gammaproteobacteria bacterium]|nr:pyruvate kinase [Gammaproteobacteria bacterium]MCH9743293.1 pyruvate kinase [Gammaproteobacteria bacterium]
MNLNNPPAVRRTKIVATLGPATNTLPVMMEMLEAGVNMVRLNFSHGTHEEQLKRIELVREAAQKLKLVVGILADLQGPKIRVANFTEGKITLKAGERFILDAEHDADRGDQQRVGIDYKELPQDVKTGDTLLLDDGRIDVTVEEVKGSEIICLVEVGGVLSNHKGINRKGGGLSAKALTDKDKEDLKFALKQEVDYIAISFPRNAEDIHEARSLIEQNKGDAGIIAKIERTEAVDEIDAIIEASDGVMVARGDLAVEIGDAQVPVVQKHIIQRARMLDKPVITATQMMESMISSTVPTRAEVSDVANAVLDYTDAVMLSAESAVGDNPVIVVETMSRVCRVAEQSPSSQHSKHRMECRFERVDEAIAMATMYTANHLDITAVVSLTESGMTALWMSRIRTAMPIYALSRFKKALGRMSLYRGVYPIYFDVTKCTRDEVNPKAVDVLDQQGLVNKGELVILTKGDHLGVGGGSNAMKILRVGEVV